ncbi:hypothetical protein MUK42_30907 [Musa troglodytarum]|uniref:Uncharacterized protein n=1 Tax=Musa troglodytarum TaxID=320322 RepID=A0A9E7FP24_9LILI|nr:hypothetical protein MUK42_30907 [Musa troglodytarum]
MVILVVIGLSGSIETCFAARHLLDTAEPAATPKLILPPMPAIPNLMVPPLPAFPTVPTVTLPPMPPIPTIPFLTPPPAAAP